MTGWTLPLCAKWWWSCIWDNDWNQTQWNIKTLLLVWKSSFYKSINSHVFLSVVGYLYNRSSLMTSFTDWFRKKAIICIIFTLSKGSLTSEGIFILVMSSKRMCKIYHYPQLFNITNMKKFRIMISEFFDYKGQKENTFWY